jgi:hypothetical protein
MGLLLHRLGMFVYEPPAVHVLIDATKALQICKTMATLTFIVAKSRNICRYILLRVRENSKKLHLWPQHVAREETRELLRGRAPWLSSSLIKP